MKFPSLILVLKLVLLLSPSSFAALTEQETNTLKLQIHLNNKNFGPGYLDARAGHFTMLAIRNYNLKHGRVETDVLYVQEAQASVKDALVTTIIPSTASKYVDASLPNSRLLQSRRKSMPYRSYAEYVAERFHTSVSFLRKINGNKTINSLGPRSALEVPNVDPFLIEQLQNGKMRHPSPELQNRHIIIDTAENQLKIYQKAFLVPAPASNPTPAEKNPEPKEIESWEEIEALENKPPPTPTKPSKPKMIPAEISDEELFASLTDADLIATFPITPGKPQFIRRGFWKIKNSIELPIWRYDKSLLETGTVGKSALIIPSGPNNPVGVLWHGLTRKGIGIHGTDSPETIGRSQSAGCIRLTNWDIVKLPTLVRPGTRVWLK